MSLHQFVGFRSPVWHPCVLLLAPMDSVTCVPDPAYRPACKLFPQEIHQHCNMLASVLRLGPPQSPHMTNLASSKHSLEKYRVALYSMPISSKILITITTYFKYSPHLDYSMTITLLQHVNIPFLTSHNGALTTTSSWMWAKQKNWPLAHQTHSIQDWTPPPSMARQ